MTQMDPMSMEDLIVAFTEWKEGHSKNLGILRGLSGITSVISSSALIWMIARSHKGLSTTQHRIILGLSISDLISSLGWSTFNSTAPSELDYWVWNARGKPTCDAQGFLIAFGIAGGLWYNAMLCLYYVAVVKYGKNEDYIRTKVEPFLHGIAIVVALAYSIVGLVRNHFNEGDGYGACNSPVYFPPHCYGYDVGDVRDSFEIPCGRGSEGGDTFAILVVVAIFIPAVIIIASLVSIYRAIKKQENKLSRYGTSALNLSPPSLWKRIKMSLSRRSSSSNNARPATRSNNMQSQSRAIMQRAFQYSAAWFFSYGMFTVAVITKYQMVFLYLATIFAPLQGFFNLCIFMYPKVKSAKKPKRGQNKKVSWYQAISIAFWSRGKENKHKRLRPQTSNLRDGRNNRPLRVSMKKNTKDNAPQMIKTPHFFRDKNKTTKDKKIYDRRESQEEEEKYEIQSPHNMLDPDRHSKVSQLTYAPNTTHHTCPVTVTHPEIDSTVQDVGEGADASETSDHEGPASEGKEGSLTGLVESSSSM